MAENEEQARIDKYIWRYTGLKSIRQISEELGIAPDAVMRRRQELRDEIDVLSVQEKQHKLLTQLEEVAMTMQGKLADPNLDQRNVAGVANAVTGAVKAASAELRKMESANSNSVQALNQLRVRELISLLQEVVDVSVVEASVRYSLDKDELFDIFNANLTNAAGRRDALEG
jgi:DNA-binding Lrp family transcriptional regulator